MEGKGCAAEATWVVGVGEGGGGKVKRRGVVSQWMIDRRLKEGGGVCVVEFGGGGEKGGDMKDDAETGVVVEVGGVTASGTVRLQTPQKTPVAPQRHLRWWWVVVLDGWWWVVVGGGGWVVVDGWWWVGGR